MGENRVSFRRIGELDIQLVRSWRNSDHVRLQMINQDVISSDDQLAWFRTLQYSKSRHYLYSFGGMDIGVVNLKPLREETDFEAGIYCGQREFLGHPINISAALGFYDFEFGQNGFRRSRAVVLPSNEPALRLNKFLGYEAKGEDTKGVLTLELTSEAFFSRRTLFQRFLNHVDTSGLEA